MRIPVAILIGLVLAAPLAAQTRPRGRDLGIPFPGKTGPNNAITDVAGIAVGHVTLIEGEGKLIPGKGPIRTGVTAILPRPKGNWDPVFAATFNLNGNGDMTGINWIKEVQSSLSLRQMLRFFRINWSDSRAVLEWALDGWAVGPATHPAISFWLFRQRTPERAARKERLH